MAAEESVWKTAGMKALRSSGLFSKVAPLIGLSIAVMACAPAAMDDRELLAAIEEFEDAVRDQPRDVVQRLLREQAARFKRSVVSVESAVVASPYVRENESNIYFGAGYNPEDHLFLSEIDPPLHEALKNHRHWVSVVKTYPSRQLSYELPVDETTYSRMRQGQEVAFSCRIAALIRGKSVYCLPAEPVLDRDRRS